MRFLYGLKYETTSGERANCRYRILRGGSSIFVDSVYSARLK